MELMSNKDGRRRPRSQEVREKISQKLRGRKLSQEQRQKMSEAKQGTVRSEETRDRVEAAHLERRMRLIGGPQNISIIQSMYDSGATIYSITKRFNISYATVRLVLDM